MKYLVKRARSSVFLRQNAIFFIGSLIFGILNYAFYPIMGRLLTVSAYGEVQILISLFNQLAIFLTVLNQVTVNIVAVHKDKKTSVISELEKVGVGISLVVCLFAALLAKPISSFFHLTSTIPLLVILIAFLITVPLTFRTAYLRGIQKFGLVSLVAIVGSALEIGFAVILVILGLGATGALCGLVLSQTVTYGYASYVVRNNNGSKPKITSYFSKPQWNVLRPEFKYSLFVLVLSLFTSLIPNLDVLTVKHYFNPQTAGLYSGVSVVARSVLYITGSLSGVLLPMLSSQRVGLSEHSKRTLVKSLLLLGLIGGSTLLIFSLFPKLIIGILMGHKYLAYAYLLPELSVAMFIFSIVNMLVVYFMALRDYWSSVIIIVSSGVIGGFMLVRHQTPAAVVSNLAYSSFIILVLCLARLTTGLHHSKGEYVG